MGYFGDLGFGLNVWCLLAIVLGFSVLVCVGYLLIYVCIVGDCYYNSRVAFILFFYFKIYY